MDTDTGEWVDLLFLTTTDGDAIHRFVCRGEKLLGLKHPHIPTVRETGVMDGSLPLPYAVMDRVRGMNLIQYLSALRAVSSNEAWIKKVVELMIPILRALSTLHAAGIVVGDFKAGSIRVTSDGRVILADLGLDSVASRGQGSQPDPNTTEDIARLGEVISKALVMVNGGTQLKGSDDPSTAAGFLTSILDGMVARDDSKRFRNTDEVARRLGFWIKTV
jgi:serine/threonine protein kinase